MKQKLFTLFLALAAGVGTMFAESGTCGENLTWNLTGGVLTISGTGIMTNYVYTNKSPWYSNRNSIREVSIADGVTNIGDQAFDDCNGLKSVTIPNSVTSIGDMAFWHCSGLTSIEIPNSVTSIGNSAFMHCSGLTSIEIPNSVTSIGNSAFYGCTGITSVTIPNSVTSIGTYIFGECTGLTSPIYVGHIFVYLPTSYIGAYSIPDGIETIAGGAFCGCAGMTSVNIPNSVTNIGYIAFCACSSLSSVTIPQNVTSIGDMAFSNCNNLISVVWEAKNCTNRGGFGSQVWHFTFGKEVESIPAYCCYMMSKLTSIIIPSSVTSIGDHAFSKCTGLKDVEVLCNTPPSFGSSNVFYECSKLSAIYVPCGTLNIYEQSWSGYKNIIRYHQFAVNGKVNLLGAGYITVLAATPCGDGIISAVSNYGYHFTKWSDGDKNNPRTFQLTQDTSFTAEFAKNKYPITAKSDNEKYGFVTGSKTIEYLDEITLTATANYGYHFEYWESDGKQYTSNPLTVTVTGNALYTAYFFPNTYNINVYSGNSSMGSVSAPQHAEYLDLVTLTANPKEGCHFSQWNDGNTDNPRTIVLAQDTTFTAEFAYDRTGTCGKDLALVWTYDPIKKVLTISNAGAFTENMHYGVEAPKEMQELVIGDGVTSIGAGAFKGCLSLKMVTIGNSVTSIGESAFSGCTGLTSVVWKAQNYSSPSKASSSPLYAVRAQITSFVFGEKVEIIPSYLCYEMNKLTSFPISNNVKDIGSFAFSGCTGLTYVDIPNSVTSIGNQAFYNCSGMTSVTIPNSVTSIGNQAFYNCSNLTSVTLNSNSIVNKTYTSGSTIMSIFGTQVTEYIIGKEVTGIGDYAFNGCTSLTSVTIPNSVTSIGNYAFNNCKGLTYITIPNIVTSIGNQAFYNCSNLTSIEIPNSVTSIGLNAFYGCIGLSGVHINNLTAWCGIAFANAQSNPLFYAGHLYVNNAEIKDLVIPNNVTSIGNYAFINCKGLTSITIPNSVTSIGNGVLCSCSGLTSVIWDSKHCADFTSTSTPFYYANNNTNNYDLRPQIKSFIFGDEVEYIPAYLCAGMKNLPEIVIPCSIKKIGKNALPENVKIVRNCGIKTSETYLTLCEGEKLIWGDNNNNGTQTIISSVKLSDSGDYEYKTKTILYDDTIATLHLTVNPKYNIVLPDTTLCYKEDLIIDGVKCTLSKVANKKQTWTRNLQTINGCDSIVNISVLWRKLPDFTVTTKDVYDTPNSGSLSYTIDKTANYAGNYYYTLNGEKNAPLQKLSAGQYRLVFYGEVCGDSIVKNAQIKQYGMRVNNQYYLLDRSNHTATMTYRGTSYDAYSGEYSSNITIPETISFEGQEYVVTGIGTNAFTGCNNIQSIIMTSKTPISISNSCGLPSSTLIYVPYGSLNAYKTAQNWSKYNIHVINPSHSSSLSSATTVTITLGDNDEAKHIVSCGMEGGEEFAGNIIEYIGLEPESQYADVPFYVKTKEGDHDILSCSFSTSALVLTTQESKPVSSNTAILLAETNMAEIETNCGFEWKRNDAPEDMPPSKVFCPVANGLMAGRLKGLKEEVYYKYRAFYQSAAGNMYYGDWKYIFTGDVAVEFDPILYTYAAIAVKENEATLKGYALAGSEDFTEQGFEYWAESRANNAPRRTAASIGEHKTVTASGISMKATLTDLDPGTVYRYRSYANIGSKRLYGSEMTLTTQGEYKDPQAIEDIRIDAPQATKILHNGQIYILRGDKIYTITGQEVR